MGEDLHVGQRRLGEEVTVGKRRPLGSVKKSGGNSGPIR